MWILSKMSWILLSLSGWVTFFDHSVVWISRILYLISFRWMVSYYSFHGVLRHKVLLLGAFLKGIPSRIPISHCLLVCRVLSIKLSTLVSIQRCNWFLNYNFIFLSVSKFVSLSHCGYSDHVLRKIVSQTMFIGSYFCYYYTIMITWII